MFCYGYWNSLLHIWSWKILLSKMLTKKKIKYKQPIKLPTMKLSGTLATRSRKWCLVEDGHYVATRIRRVYFYKVQVCVFTILPKKLFLQMGYQWWWIICILQNFLSWILTWQKNALDTPHLMLQNLWYSLLYYK